MSFFQVDPAELTQVGNNLNSLGPTMQKMKSVSTTDNGAIGGDEIQGAVSGFASTWNYGASLLEKHVETVSKNVAKAGANYQQADDNIVQKLDNLAV